MSVATSATRFGELRVWSAMGRPRIARLLLSTFPFACGPGAPAPEDPTTGSGATTTTSTGAPEPTTGPPVEPEPGNASSSSSGTSDGTGSSSSSTSTGDESGGSTEPLCDSWEHESCAGGLVFCDECEEDCPPEAQVNANVTGETPLGPFASTFAVSSIPTIYGDSSYVNLIPGYSTGDLCAITPRLSLQLPLLCWFDEPMVVPVQLFGPDDEMFATTATLSNYDCNWSGFGCFSTGHVAFDLEIQGPGWSVTGTVDAGTCRAFYDNNSL